MGAATKTVPLPGQLHFSFRPQNKGVRLRNRDTNEMVSEITSIIINQLREVPTAKSPVALPSLRAIEASKNGRSMQYISEPETFSKAKKDTEATKTHFNEIFKTKWEFGIPNELVDPLVINEFIIEMRKITRQWHAAKIVAFALNGKTFGDNPELDDFFIHDSHIESGNETFKLVGERNKEAVELVGGEAFLAITALSVISASEDARISKVGLEGLSTVLLNGNENIRDVTIWKFRSICLHDYYQSFESETDTHQEKRVIEGLLRTRFDEFFSSILNQPDRKLALKILSMSKEALNSDQSETMRAAEQIVLIAKKSKIRWIRSKAREILKTNGSAH
jgi:hypothetical protein